MCVPLMLQGLECASHPVTHQDRQPYRHHCTSFVQGIASLEPTSKVKGVLSLKSIHVT